jgi:hypothetical protein
MSFLAWMVGSEGAEEGREIEGGGRVSEVLVLSGRILPDPLQQSPTK